MKKPKSKVQTVVKGLVDQIKQGKLQPSSKLPSLNKIAKLYKVSRSTAQQALIRLKNRGYITTIPGKGAIIHDPQTRKRKLIQENCISFIFPNMDGLYIAKIFVGVENVLSKHNCYVAAFNSMDDVKLERENLKRALEVNSKAIILFPVSFYNPSFSNYDVFLKIKESGIPFVFIDNYPLHLDVDYVVGDDFKALYELTEYLIQLGHSRIAFFGGPTHISTQRQRWAGFSQAMEDAGLAIDPNLVFPCPNTPLDVHDINMYKTFVSKSADHLQKLLDSGDLPSALILVTYSFEHAEILKHLSPETLKKLSICFLSAEYSAEYDDSLTVRLLHTSDEFPEVTYALQASYEMGKKAAQIALDKIAKPEMHTVKIKIAEPVHIGESVHRVRKPVKTTKFTHSIKEGV